MDRMRRCFDFWGGRRGGDVDGTGFQHFWFDEIAVAACWCSSWEWLGEI